jgi:hypothetical protein
MIQLTQTQLAEIANALVTAGFGFAGVYAIWRTSLGIAFEQIWTAVWQTVAGPWAQLRWPGAVQTIDAARHSYLGDGRYVPLVQRPLRLPPAIRLAGWFRDGFLLGLLYALLPSVIATMLALVVLPFVMVASSIRACAVTDAARTDAIAKGIENTIAWVATPVLLTAIAQPLGGG